MSRHNYAQIPVSEAHDDDQNNTITPPQQQQQQQQQQQHRIPSPLSSRHGGYSALKNNEDDDEEDDQEHDEHDAFLGQSHPLASSSGRRHHIEDEISLAPPPHHASSSSSSSTPASTSRASTPATSRRVIGSTTDGVFSNLSAKPRVEKPTVEELPPPYKQAAMDATPAYYETTVNAPDFFDDDVLVEGLPVGGIYGFIWNFIVSMSFQFVGFFLTYLLHTSHSTKNGSKAGLGVTFISMGLQMMNGKGFEEEEDSDTGYMGRAGPSLRAMSEYIWLSYILIFLGIFLLVRSVYDFARVKRTEMIINATSSRSGAAGESDGASGTTGSRSSADDAVAAALAYIDLEAGLAAARQNQNGNAEASSSTPPSGEATNTRRDHVITLVV